jgi:hypothetical protein
MGGFVVVAGLMVQRYSEKDKDEEDVKHEFFIFFLFVSIL